MAYAENTTVPVEKSIAEIITSVKKAGAVRFGQAEEPDSIAIQFFLRERMIRFRVRLPTLEQMPKYDGRGVMLTNVQRSERAAKARRQRARALLLVIKAKLESVESEVETFDEAFLPNIVMSDGWTVMERIAEPLALEYASGKPVPMLLTGRSEPGR